MAETNYIVTETLANEFELQTISSQDTSLIVENPVEGMFSPTASSVEFTIYDFNKNLLYFDPNLSSWSTNFDSFSNSQQNDITSLIVDPGKDIENVGYNYGKTYAFYNFLQNEIGSSPINQFYISEISSDRTEIRIDYPTTSNESLEISFDSFYNKFNSPETYDYFYLNFGDNQLVIATNIYLDKSSSDYSILVKLYEPLPSQFDVKSQCYVSSKIADPVAYLVEFQIDLGQIDNINYIKGPNVNLNIAGQVNNSTTYQTFNSLTTTVNTSSFNQLKSLLEERGVEINIDYTNYSNFAYFSSVNSRLQNFYYKAKQIEDYNNEINILNTLTTTSGSSGSINLIEQYISNIITNFDGYEYYLYFESGSKAWPKTNSTPPYTLASTGSAAVLTWYGSDVVTSPYYGGQLYSASLYDSDNQNLLTNAVPDYLNDYNSDQYFTFVNMIGQSFDNVWVYIKSITDKSNADNRLDFGAPSGIVADILRSFGVNIYSNNFSVDNTYQSLLGIGADGQLYPTGSELINTIITASAIPYTLNDVNNLTYKRLYHNLPYILKKKGTLEGLKAILTLYGIPDTILRINEFGGKDKNSNTWDQWQNEYNYAFYTTSSGAVNIPFKVSSAGFGSTFPKAIAFRFKTDGLPTGSINYSQSLAVTQNNRFMISLEYTGSGYTSGSYSGSIIDPDYQYATLKFISGSQSASVYLPFYDGSWWSVLVNANSGSTTTYTLYAKNKNVDGEDGNTIGFQASSSFTGTLFWSNAGTTHLILPTGSALNGKTYLPFSGAYQEFRYYNVPLSESVFDAYVMNPYSIEGNIPSGSQSSKSSLMFRLPLGGELYINSSSVHPASTGSLISITQSFNANPQTASFSGNYSFVSNIETIYFDQPSVGIQNIVSNKIKNTNLLLPYSGSTDPNIPNNDILSVQSSIQQNYPISSSYTNDINYTEVAFSPQNEINEDIMSTLGYFNIGELIGDPRHISSEDQSYYGLDVLRNLYFEKYASNYDWNDFIRLAKYFDNSLFKLLKYYIPAKTSLASGVVIKQHLLERSKYPVPQMEFTQSEYTASIPTYTITGSNGGVWPDLSSSLYSQVTQSWTGSYSSYSGSIPFTRDDQSEFFTGDLSGSNMIVTTQSLNPDNIYITLPNPNTSSFELSPYNVLLNNASSSTLSSFFMDVDYSYNSVLPVNQQLLLSGSATKFEIPDSNYTAYRNVALRYDGSKTTSPNFNKPIYLKPSNAFINNQYRVTTPTTQSQVPNASRYSNYFVYFDYIESSYPEVPGGGNIHCTYLISIEGQAIPLIGDNKYVHDISNIFPPGLKADILPVVYSSGKKYPQLTIFDGGTKFQTICTLSGSNNGIVNGTLASNDPSDAIPFGLVSNTFLTTGSNSSLIVDSGSFMLGYVQSLSSTEIFYPSESFYIYNTSTGEYISYPPNTISPSDTLFPITVNDFLRIGDGRISGSGLLTSLSKSLDDSFNSLALVRVTSSSFSPDATLYVYPPLSSSVINLLNTNKTQNYRFFRRIENETFIVSTSLPQYDSPGFLVPENFNPAYNPYDLAKKAGIIT